MRCAAKNSDRPLFNFLHIFSLYPQSPPEAVPSLSEAIDRIQRLFVFLVFHVIMI